jgi:hypothetical protein
MRSVARLAEHRPLVNLRGPARDNRDFALQTSIRLFHDVLKEWGAGRDGMEG